MSDTPDNKPPASSEKNGRPKPERAFVKEFVDANTRIGVRVQRTQAFRPFYNICIGRFVEHDNGESFVQYLPVRSEVEHAKVKNVQDHTKLIAGLVKEATDWISAELQKREDEIIAAQQAREQRQLDREKPITKPGLKTLSKIDRVAKNYGS